MAAIQPLPALWLLSDARNDAGLEQALSRLPRGSGFIFRHYHLSSEQRIARFLALASFARARDHILILAGSAQTARAWGADGIYGPRQSPGQTRDLLWLATAHDLGEIGAANRARADAVLLSPAFPTASHPGAPALGPLRFRLLARHAQIPVIALGGMDVRKAVRLRWPRWAAIDGLS